MRSSQRMTIKGISFFLLLATILLSGGAVQAQSGAHASKPPSAATTLKPSSQAGAGALPADVDPDSRYRLPLPRREDLDDYGKQVFDKLTDPTRSQHTGIRTPAGIRLHSPHVADTMSAAYSYLRRETGFGDRLTELAILVTGREMDSQYEWAAHEPAALKAGVEPAIIDIIKNNKPVTGLGEKEAVIIKFGRELFGQRKVSSPTFAEALRLFGKRGVVDLASLMSLYVATSTLVNAFDMQMPEGRTPALPPR